MTAPMQKQIEAPTVDRTIGDPSSQKTVLFRSPATTPPHDPGNLPLRITQAQKQALIDNLQLEVTERARKLRAQYALQAQSLRTRIELRINRIPTSLRKANMEELFAKYQQVKKQEQSLTTAERENPKSTKSLSPEKMPISAPIRLSKEASPPHLKGSKRKSDEMESSGKENASDPSFPIPNPKKRAKIAAGQASRQAPNPSTVLSPKSSNSRTRRQSPTHSMQDLSQKPHLSHAASPLKPIMPPKLATPAKSAVIAAALNTVNVIVSKTKSTRGKASALSRNTSNPQVSKPISKPAVTRPKRGVNNVSTETRSVSNTSNTSATSTGTTIMRRGGKVAAVAASANKTKNVKTSAKTTTKKVALVVEGPPPGRRVLRKRA